MNPEHTRKLIGGLSAFFGVWWIWSVAYPKSSDLLTNATDIWHIVEWMIVIPLITIPGGLAIIFGIRFFQKISEPYLKWLVALFSLFIVFFISSQLSFHFEGVFSEINSSAMSFFPISLIAFCLYLNIIRLLLNHLTKLERSLSSFVTREALTLQAWVLWFTLPELIEMYVPIEEGYPSPKWSFLGFLLSIILAYGAFRIAASLLIKEQKTD